MLGFCYYVSLGLLFGLMQKKIVCIKKQKVPGEVTRGRKCFQSIECV